MYYKYWGKAKKNSIDPSFHLLPYHCLDVAAVANELLTQQPALLKNLSNALSFSPEVTKALVLFFIAIHDIGKFSISFQSINKAALSILQPHAQKKTSIHSHDKLGLALWEHHFSEIFVDKYVTWPDEMTKYICQCFDILVGCSICHHGEPVFIESEYDCLKAFNDQDIETTQLFINKMAQIFLTDIRLDMSNHGSTETFLESCKQISWWIAGLTVLSDWIGSNTCYFEYHDQIQPLENYWYQACIQAKKAITGNGLSPAVINPNLTFENLFTQKGNKPLSMRPLQKVTADIVLEKEPGLFIIEDMTGAGKTEAALFLAYRLMEKNVAEGIYFGLPTMATANGIYERLSCFYHGFFKDPLHVSLILAHANNKLIRSFNQSISMHPQEDLEENASTLSASTYCNAWMVDNNKKALLAQIGVGTIDQALQSILNNRHQCLRLFGLARKVLIIDEVHAYDTYMQTLLETLIKFHAAGGGTTILLSATLPKKTREVLIKAHYAGIGIYKTELPSITNDYPLLTQVNKQSVKEYKIPTIEANRKVVKIGYFHSTSDIEKYLIKEIEAGRCAVWIRNTVDDAIQSYERLKSYVDSAHLHLFHARFSAADRNLHENKIKSLFGKDSNDDQRRGQLLIATQVVEQSLDLDFDCMVSDLAPIELLIQRAGRLQRHYRGFRPEPILYILCPPITEEATANWFSKQYGNGGFVYKNHAQLWLTAKILSKGQLVMPDDARYLIESVFGDVSNEHVPNALDDSALKVIGKEYADRDRANSRRCQLEKGYYKNNDDDWSRLEDGRAPTRLSDQVYINFYLSTWNNGRLKPWHDEEDFAWAMSSISIAESRLKKAEAVPSRALGEFPSDQTVEDLTKLLPDKGKYTGLLIQNMTTHEWFMLRANQLYRLPHLTYTQERGLQS